MNEAITVLMVLKVLGALLCLGLTVAVVALVLWIMSRGWDH